MLKKILRHLRRRFIDAPRGFGHPVPAEAFDAEFRSGHWQLLDSPEENSRYEALVSLIRARHPKPRFLDAGCGSGRLAASFRPDELTAYHGVDLSPEAVRLAQQRLPAGTLVQQGDLETWVPPAHYDVIVLNEVAGYFYDAAATLTRLASSLKPGGVLIVSMYRWGNTPAIWRRIDARFETLESITTTNPGGDKTWDIRVLLPSTRQGSA